MTNATHTPKAITRLGAVLLCLCLSAPAFGQLTLDAFAPAHGETDVDLEATLTLTFSAPIDTTGSFAVSDGFFLGIDVVPEAAERKDIALSADGRTVTIGLTLQTETQYWAFLSGATSTTGDALDRPYAFTFTTGSRLPTASVSGTARFDGGQATGALVGLFPETFFDALFNDNNDENDGSLGGGGGNNEDDDGNKNKDATDNHDGTDFAAISIVTDASGAFTIDFVPPGRYLMLALKDANQDGDLTLGEDGEGFGAHDADGNRVPEVIEVQQEALDGFEVALEPFIQTTARDHIDDAYNLVGEAVLTAALAGDLSPEGEANAWAFFFYDETTRDTLGVVAFFNLLGIVNPAASGDSTGTCDPILCDITLPLPDDWIDSHVALTIAEEIGGAAYRTRHPDATVNAILTTLELDFTGSLLAKTTAAAPQPGWLISYQAPEDQTIESFEILIALIHAQTGEVLHVIGRATTADDNIDDATAAAQRWQSDAQLVSVVSLEPLDPEGQSTLWNYVYYSPATNTARSVLLSSRTLVDQSDIDQSRLPSLDPLPENWVDSSVAAAEADAQSHDFRAQHPDATVFAHLSRGFQPSAPDRPVWRFSYVSAQDLASLELDIDANTGQVIVSAEEDAEVPEAIVLHQNYPNPFNPETTLAYDVHRAGRVDLTIYNVLGQTVRTLVGGALHTPGTHTVTWNGLDDAGQPAASGFYFYTIRLDDAVVSKVMTLLR